MALLTNFHNYLIKYYNPTLMAKILSLLLLFCSIQHLPAQEIPNLQTSFGHKEQVNKLTFSQDGEYLLSASQDQTVKIWNGRTFKLIRTFLHDAPVRDMAISTDNQLIVTVSDKIHFWDRATGKLEKTIAEKISLVRFGPKGNFLLTGKHLRDAKSHKVLHTFPNEIDQADFHPEQARLATSSGEMIYLWALPAMGGATEKLILLDSTNALAVHQHSVVYAWQSEQAVSGYNFGYTNESWYADAFRTAEDGVPAPYRITSLVFCGDKIVWGDKLANGMHSEYKSASKLQGFVNAWNWKENVTQIDTFKNFLPYALAYHPDQPYLVAGGDSPQDPNLRIILIDPSSFSPKTEIKRNSGNIQDLAIHPKKAQVLLSSQEGGGYFGVRNLKGEIRFLDFDDPKKEMNLLEEFQYAKAGTINALQPNLIRISPDNSTLMIASENRLHFFDLANFQLKKSIPLIDQSEWDLRQLTTTSKDSEVIDLFRRINQSATLPDLLVVRDEMKGLSGKLSENENEKLSKEFDLYQARQNMDMKKARLEDVIFTPDGKYLIVIRKWSYILDVRLTMVAVRSLNLETYEWETTYCSNEDHVNNGIDLNPGQGIGYPAISLAPDDRHLLVRYWAAEEEVDYYFNECTIFDIISGKWIRKDELVRHPDNWPTPWIEKKEMPDLADDPSIWTENNQLFSAKNKKDTLIFSRHTATVTDWAISTGAKPYLFSIGDDLFTRIWDLNTGEALASLQLYEEDQFLLQSSEDYYLCTPGAGQKFSFLHQGAIFAFEEFDLIYNRPDIVLSRLGFASEPFIEAYQKAYQKRLQVLQQNQDQMIIDQVRPIIELSNAAELPHQSTEAKIRLVLTARQHPSPITQLQVWINGVPIEPNLVSGSLSQISSQALELNIELTPGPNRIEFSVIDQAGVASQRLETFVFYQAGQNLEKPDLYLLALGVSKFQQSQFNLNYAHKDAGDVAKVLGYNQGLFNHIYVDTLYDEDVTIDQVIQLKDRLKNSHPRDAVVLFIASHGTLDEDLNFYLATHDMNFDKPKEKGLAYEQLEGLLHHIPARQKLLLIDACHSGEVDKGNIKVIEVKEDNKPVKFFRAFGQNKLSQKQIGLENAFELMKATFADLRRGGGATVLSAAGGLEYAMEDDAYSNGTFTYSLLQGLLENQADLDGNGQIMVSELEKYLARRVSEITGGAQQPTSRIVNLSNDWRIW